MKRIIAGIVMYGAFVASALAAPTAQLSGGKTTVVLDPAFVGALINNNIAPSKIAPGALNLNRGVIAYPIPTGALDAVTLVGDIFHKGGLIVADAETEIALQNFVIDVGGAVLTGVVSQDGESLGRLPLFDLDLSGAEIADGPARKIKISNVELTLTSAAAGLLNMAFDLHDDNALTGDTVVGVAAVNTQVTRLIGAD